MTMSLVLSKVFEKLLLPFRAKAHAFLLNVLVGYKELDFKNTWGSGHCEAYLSSRGCYLSAVLTFLLCLNLFFIYKYYIAS